MNTAQQPQGITYFAKLTDLVRLPQQNRLGGLIISTALVAFPAPSAMGQAGSQEVSSLLKELEKELQALEQEQRQDRLAAKAKAAVAGAAMTGTAKGGSKGYNTPTQRFKALNVAPLPRESKPTRLLESRLKSLQNRIAHQRLHLENRFAQLESSAHSHMATIASQWRPDAQHPITNLQIYLDDTLVFAAEPMAALQSPAITLYQNTLEPRSYTMTLKGSRLIEDGDVMRLEDFAVKAPWHITKDQQRHYALIKPMVTADGKPTLEVLFD